jgi:hypothetical protein
VLKSSRISLSITRMMSAAFWNSDRKCASLLRSATCTVSSMLSSASIICDARVQTESMVSGLSTPGPLTTSSPLIWSPRTIAARSTVASGPRAEESAGPHRAAVVSTNCCRRSSSSWRRISGSSSSAFPGPSRWAESKASRRGEPVATRSRGEPPVISPMAVRPTR